MRRYPYARNPYPPHKRYKRYTPLKYPQDMIPIIEDGLPNANNPKNVIIIGAGMAGLVSGYLLKKAGHKVTILEGNDRIGGRVYTLREPFSPENYLDMGAMRIPENHYLVNELIKKFDLPTNSFINTTDQDIIYANGVKTTRAEYNKNPDILKYPVEPHEKGKTASQLLMSAVQPFLTLYNNSSPEQRKILLQQFDRYSIENYLRFNPIGPSLSPEALRMVKVMLGIEGFAELSFINILFDVVNTVFNEDLKFNEITGGNDQLPKSFYKDLKPNIHFNEKVNKITTSKDSVSVQARNTKSGKLTTYTGDILIVTIPFSVFQFIEVTPFETFSFEKWKAIRELHYVAAVKIGIEFNKKFWEEEGLAGANVLTDFPNRFTYTPSPDTEKQTGVVLASYSWGDNAKLWNALTEDERIRQALQDLAKIHGDQVYDEFLNGASFSWSQNPFSAGCFTLFKPNQAATFPAYIRRPEGRIHFAGEHASDFQGWIEGAVQSGVRAAHEVNARP
ncbi:flavin monoamine oxidase family protein [Pseudalkalibacillus berkeleyi]|uniref:FAD-dependent oxidoreductase n=1 Tax=Pseudalkalibacillus berkeleyi TaxID=1069813 RepID=A0ABS9H556_9BACL|nr:flavin monoamine oxidase family protein [Pseudalkalibacillus berkeleyi]MCF6139211.1 FAD-dependent oxidoreductase [Pseudalkalibacillus berkeleyi]